MIVCDAQTCVAVALTDITLIKGVTVMRLKGKTALIAGASRNIGRAIALAFAKASDESPYVTGDRMICAGGRYM